MNKRGTVGVFGGWQMTWNLKADPQEIRVYYHGVCQYVISGTITEDFLREQIQQFMARYAQMEMSL